MVDGDGCEPKPLTLQTLPRFESRQFDERTSTGCETLVIRPDTAIEPIASQAVEHGLAAMDDDTIGGLSIRRIQKDWQTGDVVRMAMSEENVANT